MSTLSDLQAKLATLRAARVSGVLETRHGDTSITYKSDADMASAEASLVAQIAAAGGTSATRGPKYINQTSKGL